MASILRRPRLMIGDIPSRTCVECLFVLKGNDPNNPLNTPDVVRTIKSYRCLDCSYTTSSLDEMNDHQMHQKKHHGYWQRFRRFLHMFYHNWFH